MYGSHVHPYFELLLNERLHPKTRNRIKPVVTEPLPCRLEFGARVRGFIGSAGNRFSRNVSTECCPASCS